MELNNLRKYFDDVNFCQKLVDIGFIPKKDNKNILSLICKYCHIKVYGWDKTQDPLKVHLKINKKCPAIMKLYYNSELNRINSYPKTWSGPPIESMAKSGFVYLESDKVICFSCLVCFDEWNKDDNPYLVHSNFNSKCSFSPLSNNIYPNIQTSPSAPMFEYPDHPLQNPTLKTKRRAPLPPINNQSNTRIINYNCMICGNDKKNVVAIPCGHVVSCINCINRLRERQPCPVCMYPVDKFLVLIF